MGKSKSEDTLILYALTPGLSHMASVYEALSLFSNLKKSTDPSNRFNIIFFQEDGPNFLESFTLNPDYIIMALKSLEPVIVKGNVGGGIFLSISIIIDVFKKVSEKSFRLIVLSDSGSPKIAPLYMPILESMTELIKCMPFTIDVVRVGTHDGEEDTKLMRLAARANGTIHRINDISSLSSILKIIATQKEKSNDEGKKEEKLHIPKEKQFFYINLADDPIKVNHPDTCSICYKKDFNAMLKCPNCGVMTHKICLALWSKDSSIGIPNIFRCHNCYYLIKLDETFVERVKLAQKVEEAKILPQKDIVDIHDYLESLEAEDGPKIVHINDPMGIPAEEFIENEMIKIEESTEDQFTLDDDEETKFMLCPYCFKMITNKYKRCPNCHKTIKK
ncbi:MAG: hypothetical protein EU539_06390 [Promethearchaeota archaeon]|nr:MAG: hypothetical protein EU539_06390 [Candidatus Lokiarchaeota archaeon]